MQLTRSGIAELIPHTGAMCLLDGIVAWDAERVRAVSRTHLDPANPLRVDGRLSALSGVEYAAQAMAAHGRLTGDIRARPRAGYLAAVRDVVCLADRLDAGDGVLVVDVERLIGEGERVIYAFTVRVGEAEIVRGRATVVLEAHGGDPQ